MHKPLDALILDKDGVIFDSERIYAETLKEALAAMNLPVDPGLIARFTGLDSASTFALLCEILGQQIDTDALIDDWLRRKDIVYQRDGLPFMPGADKLIRRAYEAGYPLALVTSDSLDRTLEDFSHTDYSLMQCFSVIITVDDVVNPKPDPEPYLRATAFLGIDPQHALVVEDSDHGANAALAAGANVLLLPGRRQVAADIAGRVRAMIAHHDETWEYLRAHSA
ncbi:MAG: HAD family phosphatase [Cardiobacteriaceae bacterium]|nr:HAD family phosphatase [Cardiobacteriaceae bacterium]